MKTFTKSTSLILGCLLASEAVQAAPNAVPLPFVANHGQWEKRVQYAVTIPDGRLYLEGNCFTYQVFAHPAKGAEPAEGRQQVPSHAFRVTMVGAAAAPAVVGEEKQSTYHNYFLGNDPRHWASAVPLFAGVRYRAVYPGIDMRWHQHADAQLEYDFELAPGARPAAIRMRYDGLDGLALTPEGHLQLRTSVGEMREQAPVAWQLSATGARRAVPCRFVLRGKEISFALGKGYNPAERLVIDPTLVFATYSGSSGGMSANTTVSDSQGNMYTGGYVLGSGYPVTLGAIKSQFQYGNIGISKLSATGRNLLYATYLGGNSSPVDDYPLDLEVNAAGELLILGATISPDFPTTAGAYSRQINSSRDLVITRINATGSAVLASTFLGGSSEEAGGTSTVPASLAVDPNGDVLVVSSTRSSNYPVLNAQQPTSGSPGLLDAVVTRLNSNLTALRWSTYLGGTADDRGHDVKVAPNGDVYVCGATSSSNFPVGTGGLVSAAPGGTNGFVVRYSAAGVRLSGTFLGTNFNDVARFLDFDANGQVLVGGSCDGAYPLTNGTFSAVVPGSTSVFIHALSPALSTTLFSTQISVAGLSQLLGSNVITAFGRDDCGRLYFSAYAGSIVSPGCPRTADAFSMIPRSLYLCVLNENATSLLYGTYIGEPNSNPQASFSTHLHFAAANQVTRAGTMYHITCNTGRGFGTTPGAFSTGLTFVNDGAAFKFDLAPVGNTSLQLAVATPPTGCAPYNVQFVNTTSGSVGYSWDFGDGSPLDTARAPRHNYVNGGTYTARLVATRRAGPAGCGPATATITVPVTVSAPLPLRTALDSLGCNNRQLVLDPARLTPPLVGRAFAWGNGTTTPTLAVTTSGRYRVEIDLGQPCPTVLEYNVINAIPRPTRTVSDSLDCGQLLVLNPARLTPFVSGRAYKWSTGAQTPTVAVTTPGRYRVEIEQGFLCPAVVEFNIRLAKNFAIPNILTANGDAFNALFKVPASYGVPQLKIFNRWGVVVYETAAYRNDWTGSNLPGGVYYYQIRQPSCNVDLKGWVEIVR